MIATATKTEAKSNSHVMLMLKSWYGWDRQRQKLEKRIEAESENVAKLKDELSPDGILSSVVVDSTKMATPRGTGVSDPAGNRVVRVLDKLRHSENEIESVHQLLTEVNARIAEVEAIMSVLSAQHRDVLAYHYRDGCGQSEAARRLGCSRYQVDKFLREAIMQLT